MSAVEIVIVGAAGRMGRAIADAAGKADVVVAGSVVRGGPASGMLYGDLAAALAATGARVVIDVSSPHGAGARMEEAARSGAAVVQGTSGLDKATLAVMKTVAKTVAVVHAPNFSLGLTVMRYMMTAAASGLDGWDFSLLDRHHRAKRDSPSGTAHMLAQASTVDLDIASFRQGGVVGEHTVFASGPDEELVLTHRAFDRSAFARGALAAAKFSAAAGPGLYGMDHVLGLHEAP